MDTLDFYFFYDPRGRAHASILINGEDLVDIITQQEHQLVEQGVVDKISLFGNYAGLPPENALSELLSSSDFGSICIMGDRDWDDYGYAVISTAVDFTENSVIWRNMQNFRRKGGLVFPREFEFDRQQYDAAIKKLSDLIEAYTKESESKKLLDEAIAIAVGAHRNMSDKTGMPYVIHVLRVMEAGKTIEEKILGALHDLIEDKNWLYGGGHLTSEHWTFERLEKSFPKHIIDALRCVTKIDDESYDDFIERVKSNPLAVKVKINDLIDTMNTLRLDIITETDVECLKECHSAYKTLTSIH